MDNGIILDLIKGNQNKGIKEFRDGVVSKSLKGEDVSKDMTLLKEIDTERYRHYDIIEGKIFRMLNIMRSDKTRFRIEGMIYSLYVLYDLEINNLDDLFNMGIDNKDKYRKALECALKRVKARL